MSHSRTYSIDVGSDAVLALPDVEVLVIGGGTAGVVAAIAAARNGAKTLVVESMGFLGGSQTGALVTPIMDYHCGAEALVRGIHEEMVDRLNATGGFDGVWHSAEALKRLYDEMVEEIGVGVLYYTQAIDTVVENGALTGVVLAGKGGLRLQRARQSVDATGDADVARLAGVPCVEGRERDGVNQPASLRFLAGGIETARLVAYLRQNGVSVQDERRIHVGYCRGGAQDLRDLWEEATARGELMPPEDGVYIQLFSVPGCPGLFAFNCPRVTGVRGTDTASLTRAATLGRQRAHRILGFCKRNIPGFESAYMALTAPMVGIRESRRILGEYVLVVEDVLAARKFGDVVAKSRYPVDIHNPDHDSGGVTLIAPPEGDYYEIPYRCLVPLKVDDLLVAGRCVSATFEAQAAVRVQATCRAMGEAAGTAAALCCRDGVPPRRVDAEALLTQLAEQGANVARRA